MKNPLLKSYCVVMDQDLVKAVDEIARETGFSRSQVINGALRMLIAGREETRRKRACQTSERS